MEAPVPLGKMGRRLQEIRETEPEQRPIDLYADLAQGARSWRLIIPRDGARYVVWTSMRPGSG